METTLRLAMSGTPNAPHSSPRWNREVRESFALYHELESLRDRVGPLDTVLMIDECLGHLLQTLNLVVADLDNAPMASDQPAFKEFMRQIARRLQAENRSVKSLIRQVTETELTRFNR
ncbi:hypothetical protein ACFPMF_00885 [Larkinella bovis]|uniref:Uncharacterized protein n=1 Tax=Larkinella bovis TaxID=683041 RepID=A0ABW0I5G8_9BACT